MAQGKHGFVPDWSEKAPIEGSWRSIFKWGDPLGFKHPNEKMYHLVLDKFKLSDDFFKERKEEISGDGQVKLENRPPEIDQKHVDAMIAIVGKENISQSDYDRVKYSSGKTYEETFEMRRGILKEITDLVVHPRDKEDVKKIVKYCNENKLPIYIWSAGSSVNFGCRPMKHGITLVMSTHMNKIISIDELTQTVRVQPGMMGPAFEEQLNNAKKLFGTKYNYTEGHFPQSFEFSTVGGWIAALGSGQQSSYYGDAYHLVLEQEYVTPEGGTFNTNNYPGTASGPKLNDIMKGSEGTLGVLVEITWRLYRYQPENQKGFAFIFKTWEGAVDACREIAQGEFGMPGVFRLSDAEESEVGLRLYGVADTWIEKVMNMMGFKEGNRCMLLGRTEGEKNFSKNVKKQVKKICKAHGGMYITGYPVKGWEEGRYADPYMREDLDDYGIMLDTLETGVKWADIHAVHDALHDAGHKRKDTIIMSHASHFYPQGTNLYCIFFGACDDVEDYKRYQESIIDSMIKAGGSPSHHHGTGRMIGPWMHDFLGKDQINVLRAIKRHFDPNNIMNPGAQLGLDYDPEELDREGREWRIDWNKHEDKVFTK